MMKGYNTEEALAYILPKIDRKAHKALGDKVDTLIVQAIEGDMLYMEKAGVIDSEGNGGGSYYDDDDAIEYMLEYIVEKNGMGPDDALLVASLLDDFMDYQFAYMESKGLVAWE